MSRRRGRAGLSTLLMASISGLALSASATAESVRPSLNLYGTTGLIDMPTAQSQPDGETSFTISGFGDTLRRSLTFQILPRLSGTVRYTTIDNWGIGLEEINDRSFDFQFRLLDEQGWRPSVAIGLRDFLSNGVYSSEYIVATKTVTPDVTVSAGVGWGRMSGVGDFKNPFCGLSSGLCGRDTDFEEGGRLSPGTYFQGERAAVFGGVEWRTPVNGLTLKAEYSSDDYTEEQAGGFERDSPLNFGLEYRLRERVTLGAYYMYGSEVGFSLAVSGNPRLPVAPQNLGAGPIPVNARPDDSNRSTNWAANPESRDRLGAAISEVLGAEGITVEQISFQPDVVEVFIINRQIAQMPKAIGRTARVLSAGLPHSVERFRITAVEGGVATTTVEIDRSALEAQVDRPDAGLQSWQTARLSDAAVATAEEGLWRSDLYPSFGWRVAPLLTLVEKEADNYRLQASIDASAKVEVARGLSVSGSLRQPVLGIFDDPGASAPGALPPVRRDSARYFSEASPKLMRLTGDYLFKLTPDTYGRVSAGYLERQYGGVSGEVLWKPMEQNWGLGVELNYVVQRDPDDFAGFDDYEVATGHASVYWDTGFMGMEAQIDAGRYLAGDWGATVSVTRRFENGWAVGAYATLTEVSAEDFGRGSYDKGITVSIPLRWTVPFETRQTTNVNLTERARDGGARLNVANRLYPIVRDMDRNRLEQNWGAFWQ